MSKIKIAPKNKMNVAILNIQDKKHDALMQVWAYPDIVLLVIDGKCVSVTPKQFEKIIKFVDVQVQK